MTDPTPTTSGVHKPLDRSAWVRRADVALRAQYPNLITRIFETQADAYVVVFDQTAQDAAAVDVDKVRPVTLRMSVSNTVPSSYLRELELISDRDLARNFEGFPFSKLQLLNLIRSRFPDLPIFAVRDGLPPTPLRLELGIRQAPADEAALLKFCNGLGFAAPFELVVADFASSDPKPAPKTPQPSSDPMTVLPSRSRPTPLPFVRMDEAFWFDNIDRVYAGKLGVNDIPGLIEGDSRCFVDATIGKHTNIRQLLTLYDTVYLSPPLAEGHDVFLAEQALSEEDLLTLIENGRLKLLGTQAEERLKLPFLSAAADRAPTAIIGRRTTAAMIIADIVNTANQYRLSDPANFEAVGALSRLLSRSSGIPPDQILQFILWPLSAERASLAPLLERGSKGMMTLGVGNFAAALIQKSASKDLTFECLYASEKVHIGHALNATVFPFREEPEGVIALSNLMGEALNFFRSFNTEIAPAWLGNVERKQLGRRLLPPLPLLEFDPAIPITEFLQAVESVTLRNKGRALFSRIAELDEEQRLVEVQKLNAALRKFGRPAGLVSLENMDTGIGLLSTALGWAYPPVTGLRAFGSQIIDLGRKNRAIDRFIDQLQQDWPGSGQKRELDFVSKISRVATLKTTKVS